MDLFGGIGKFLGGLFGGNKKDDEEKRRRQQQAAQPRQSATAPVVAQQNRAYAQMPGSLVTPNTRVNPLTRPEPLILGGVKPNDGLTDEDRAVAKSLANKGKDTTKFVAAARQAKISGDKARYENSFTGKVANTAGEVAKSLVESPVKLAEGFGTALASNSKAVRDADAAVRANQQQDIKMVGQLNQRLKDPNLDPSARLRIGDFRNKLIAPGQSEAEKSQTALYKDMAAATDPVQTILNAAGTIVTPLVGGVSGKGAKSVAGAVVDSVIDPVSVLNRLPKNNAVGRLLDTQITNSGRSKIIRDYEKEFADGIIEDIPRPIEQPTVGRPTVSKENPTSPITATPTTSTTKPGVISSNQKGTVPIPPQPLVSAPQLATPEPSLNIPVPEAPRVPTPEEILLPEQQAIQEAAAEALPLAPEVAVRPDAPQIAEAEAIANMAAPVNPEAVAAQIADEAAAQAPTEAILGSISRQSIADGRINTPDGRDAMLAEIELAAEKAADDLGTDISSIIRKGQQAWQKSNSLGRDLTPAEAATQVKGFTPEQQAIYKAYAQEIGTLRDRSGLSIGGGNQGEWYGPRQAVNEVGESAEFDPRMVNEIRRNRDQSTGGVPDNELDVSTTPYQQAIQRYADSPTAAAQTVIETAETNLDTGAQRLVIPDATKEKLETALASVVEKRDQAMKLADEGDTSAAKKLQSEVNGDIDKAFTEFMNAIPGSGKERRQAINDVKAIRGAYKQTSTQTLALSNVVNRVADQGAKLVLGSQQPLVRALNKAFGEFIASKAAAKGGPVFKLNDDKNARKAAKELASGTLWNEIKDTFNTNVSMAGAGRSPVVKAISKIDSFINASGTAATQAGDISSQILRRTFELGMSRPEAQGLKTVDEYKQYLSKYITTNEFKRDLDDVGADLLPRIGLAGSKNDTVGGGKISQGLSKVDNAVKIAFEKAGITDNRLVDEINGYVKSNITGYAGVGSRVFGTIANAAAGGVPKVVKAIKAAESGDPAAVAKATQIASQSVADAIALYGTAGVAAAVAANGGDVIGFTGAQPEMGSSEASYRQANGIPANQWYVNIGGDRIYFDPARPTGAPGVGADIAGGLVANSGNPLTTTQNAFTQAIDQVGGTSIVKTLNDVMTVGNTANTNAADYARRNLEKTLAPGTGIFNNIANFTDSRVRDPQNFIEDIKSNIPVLRGEVGTRKDARGNEIKNIRQASGGSWIFGAGKNPDGLSVDEANSTDAEINRLQKEFKDVFPTKAASNATLKNTPKLASLLIGSSMYQDADDEGRAKLMAETLKGTPGKDISDNLTDEQQTSLLSAKLMGEDKKKVWLEDNNNAASYYRADYDNAKANGTLKSTDENLQEKGGKLYKAIRSEVDRDFGADNTLKQLYDNTSETEWRAMVNPESEDYDLETAQKLLAYDDARTKAGVSGKSSDTAKNKYKVKTAGSGRGGRGRGGGSGGGNFSFASMPQSLTGVKSNEGYAKEAPTFKPIADLKAPEGKAIPKGRTISIKKGIQI